MHTPINGFWTSHHLAVEQRANLAMDGSLMCTVHAIHSWIAATSGHTAPLGLPTPAPASERCVDVYDTHTCVNI